jgi:hypothetical protein
MTIRPKFGLSAAQLFIIIGFRYHAPAPARRMKLKLVPADSGGFQSIASDPISSNTGSVSVFLVFEFANDVIGDWGLEPLCLCRKAQGSPRDHLRDQAANRAEISPHPAPRGSSGQLGWAGGGPGGPTWSHGHLVRWRASPTGASASSFASPPYKWLAPGR